MARHRGGSRNSAAQGECAVGGHIGDVQHAEAEEQRQGNQRVDKAQLQRAKHSGKGEHGRELPSLFKMQEKSEE